MSDVIADEVCSVSFELSTLSFAEVARLAIRSRMPRARRPVLRYAFLRAYVTFVYGFFGYALSTYFFRPGIATPDRVVIFCSMVVLLPLFRMYAAIDVTRKLLASRGTSTFVVDAAGLSRQTDHREIWHDWAGVVDVRLTAYDVIFLFDIGDFALIPRRAFDDREHEARFLKVAGMVSDRLWLRPPDR